MLRNYAVNCPSRTQSVQSLSAAAIMQWDPVHLQIDQLAACRTLRTEQQFLITILAAWRRASALRFLGMSCAIPYRKARPRRTPLDMRSLGRAGWAGGKVSAVHSQHRRGPTKRGTVLGENFKYLDLLEYIRPHPIEHPPAKAAQPVDQSTTL